MLLIHDILSYLCSQDYDVGDGRSMGKSNILITYNVDTYMHEVHAMNNILFSN